MANRFVLWVWVCLAVAACTSASYVEGESGAYTVLYRSAWRDGIDPRLTIQAPLTNSISTVMMPPFHEVALKATMHRSDDFAGVANGTPRAEIVFESVARFAIGKEYKIRWSTMIPPGYTFDSLQPEIITQLHQGGAAGSPPFSLMLADGHYRVDVRGGAAQANRSFVFGSPTADRGKVVTWLLRYRPDDKGPNSLTDLYEDGARVVQSSGDPNAYPGDLMGYLKMGIYKWWWKTRASDVSDRTIYYGNVDIAERVPERR